MIANILFYLLGTIGIMILMVWCAESDAKRKRAEDQRQRRMRKEEYLANKAMAKLERA